MTARSAEKGQRIVESIDETLRRRVSYVVVENVAKEGAFDEVISFTPAPRGRVYPVKR